MRLLVREIKKIVNIVIIGSALIAIIAIWYRNGFSIVESTRRIEQIPIHNVIHMLDEDCCIDQIFRAGSDYLVGVDVMLVNTSENGKGELVVQLLDMWGDVIAENHQALSSIESGVYQRIPLEKELNLDENEEFQIRLYTQGADITPGIVSVSEEEDVEENTLCYYNADLTERGLVIGYVFGHEEFTGYQYWRRDKNQKDIATTIMVLAISGMLLYAVNAAQLNKLRSLVGNQNIYYQLTLISALFSAFFLSAIINKIGMDIHIPVFVYVWLIGTALLMALTIYLYMRKIYIKRQSCNARKKQKDLPDITANVGIALFTVITRVPMFTVIQKWDGAIYYGSVKEACQNFDFTISGVWNNFKLAGHPTFAYTFFLGIGEFLFPARVTGVLLVQLILTIAALICIYKMLRYYWSAMTAFQAMMSVFLLAIQPIFWGSFSYVNVDYTLVIFFIFMLYAEYKKQNIMVFFWMFCLLLNKETGWVIVAGYFCNYFISTWKETRGKTFKEKTRYFGRKPMSWAVILGVIGICFYTISQGSLFSWMGTGVAKRLFVSWKDIKEKGLGINSIGFYPPYVLHKFAQMFILNFMWIPSLMIIICCVIIVKQKRKKRIRNLGGMLGGLVAFALFNMLFVTHALYRYMIFSVILVFLIALILGNEVCLSIRPNRMSGIVIGILAIFFVIQNFYFIDPVSNAIFEKLDSGRGTILSTDMDLNGYGDTLVNNYRYTYIDRLLDTMLEEAGYNSDMQVIELGEHDSFAIRGFGEIYALGWDVAHNRRICQDVSDIKTEIIPINQIYMTSLETNGGEGISKNAIVYFMQYFGHDEEIYLEKLKQYYNIGERKEISNWGGTLSYYRLERKG